MYKTAILVASDSSFEGRREDLSGPEIFRIVSAFDGLEARAPEVLPDSREALADRMRRLADEGLADLILTTGGTGFSRRDVTPEATRDVTERSAPGIAEAARHRSLEVTPRGMLSRGEAGIRGGTLIVNLPGSPKAVREILEYLLPALLHGLDMLQSRDANCAATPERPKRD